MSVELPIKPRVIFIRENNSILSCIEEGNWLHQYGVFFFNSPSKRDERHRSWKYREGSAFRTRGAHPVTWWEQRSSLPKGGGNHLSAHGGGFDDYFM